MTRRRPSRTVPLGAGHALPGAGSGVPMTSQGARNGRSRGSGATEAPEASNYTAVLSRLTEKQFQAMLVAGLRQRGFVVWTVPNMRLTTAGLPDVLAIHPRWPALLAWELKTATGRATEAQLAALRALGAVAGVDARIVRPVDWFALRDTIDAVLAPAPACAVTGGGRLG